jgi:hypothetical protein
MDCDQELAQFWLRLRERLEAGARAYGEASFRREATELAGEIEQELVDVCGWAFILWCRLRRLGAVLGSEGDVNLSASIISSANIENSVINQ